MTHDISRRIVFWRFPISNERGIQEECRRKFWCRFQRPEGKESNQGRPFLLNSPNSRQRPRELNQASSQG